ncbi:MAG: MlaD family protein [Chroococcales cyanobacterium]
MRSRTIREGSVGLFILAGIALFVGLGVWLRGFEFGKTSYTLIIEFANASGMKPGAAVRYRGVEVGKIVSIDPSANGVDVQIEINDPELHIPKQVLVEANQAGLISETSIDITPLVQLSPQAKLAEPTNQNCSSDLILCDSDRIEGQIGASFEELIRGTVRLTQLYTDEDFFANVSELTESATVATKQVADLTQELSTLSRSVRQEVNTFSTAANAVTNAANQTASQVTVASSQLTETANVATQQVTQLSNQLSQTAEQYTLTAAQLNELATNMNSLVVDNRGELVSTLNNISTMSEEMRALVVSLRPTLDQFNQSVATTNTQELVQNLETLTANAAEASANLRDISSSLNDPTNQVVLQQTLDAARATFANTQKITADLDELTGNPEFRNNLLNLVNGLSSIVSSTEQLEENVYHAQVLEPVNESIQETAQVTQEAAELALQPKVSGTPEESLPASAREKKNPKP